MDEIQTTAWNGIPPNGQGMYHWLVNKDHKRHVVAWFDLHEWTAFGKAQTKQEIAAMYDYLAPCEPPSVKEVPQTHVNAPSDMMIVKSRSRTIMAAKNFSRLMSEFEGELQYCGEAMNEVMDAADQLMALEAMQNV